MHKMGEFISEQRVARYDLATFEGMLPSIDELDCKRIGEQGSLVQWHVSLKTFDLPLGYMTARPVQQHLAVRFYRMEWDQQETPVPLPPELDPGDGWVRVGLGAPWSEIMADTILSAIEADLLGGGLGDVQISEDRDLQKSDRSDIMAHQDRTEEIAQQRELLLAHRRTLHYYLIQQAKRGGIGFSDPGIQNGIDEARSNIRRIKGKLREWEVSVDDQPDDEAVTHEVIPPGNPGSFQGIVLEPEQENLLGEMVEAIRKIPRQNRTKFIIFQGDNRTTLVHPGLSHSLDVYVGDLEIFSMLGLINLVSSTRGLENCDVTPIGMKYYELLKSRSSSER